MYALKKKSMLQKQIDTIMGTMITMEQQKMALENAATYYIFLVRYLSTLIAFLMLGIAWL